MRLSRLSDAELHGAAALFSERAEGNAVRNIN